MKITAVSSLVVLALVSCRSSKPADVTPDHDRDGMAAADMSPAMSGSDSTFDQGDTYSQESVEPYVQFQEQSTFEPEPFDAASRYEAAVSVEPSEIAPGMQFAFSATGVSASTFESLPDVAAALISGDKQGLIGMCSEEMPRAAVLPAGTWVHVMGTNSEMVVFDDQWMEVECLHCQVLDGPQGSPAAGTNVVVPRGWLAGRVVADAR